MTKGSIRARRRIRPAVLVLLVVACGASGGAGSSAELAREVGVALRAGDAVALEQLHPPAWRDFDADVEGELSLLRGISLDGLCVVVDEDFPVAHSMRFFADAAGPDGVEPWSMTPVLRASSEATSTADRPPLSHYGCTGGTIHT